MTGSPKQFRLPVILNLSYRNTASAHSSLMTHQIIYGILITIVAAQVTAASMEEK